jgi:hypothetical protein
MARPHPVLLDLAVGRPMSPVDDFDELLSSAFEHRMHGLLWSHVSRGDLVGPSSWEHQLAMLSLRDEARHRRLWEVLGHVEQELASIGVRIATLKGVAAEARWYDRLGERPCYDVDILVDPSSLDRADEAVEMLEPDHELLGSITQCVRRGELQFLELHVDGERVDVHFDPLKMRIECRQKRLAWERMVVLEGPGGVSVRAYDTELSLLYFLLHLNRDSFRYLLGFVDVAHILSRAVIDQSFFHQFIEDEGIAEPTRSSLAAVCETLGLQPLPPSAQPGPRRSIWRLLWRPGVRIQGGGDLKRYWLRGQYLLPMLYEGRLSDTLHVVCRRAKRGRKTHCESQGKPGGGDARRV